MSGDDVDGSADTIAGRSPSEKALHDDVRAALFAGGKLRDDLESGAVLAGRYRITALLGRGGMGEVYRAHDLELREDVAIKFLPRAYASNPALRARFVNEVRIARQITHPSVCRVHDIGEADGRHFLSMELIDGEDLSSLLRRIGRLPQEKALELAQQLCAGLAALHARGVLHRDLKPSNVMIDGEGRLKLADFGLAAVEAELRPEDMRDGTPAYMAPEQAAGKEVTVKSDIFALGLVLYELIAGRHAFASGSDATGKPRFDRSSTPASIATHVRGLPHELDDVIRACIDPDSAARPSSVLAVAAALPGGDPVAAAIAAGRAPSVEAVAGSKLVGTLPAWLAYGIAAFIAVSMVAFAAMENRSSVLGAYSQMSVDVLRHRAREVLEAAGHTHARGDEVVALDIDRQFLAAQTEGEIEGDAGPLRFVYRQSAENLISLGPGVTVQDPPLLDRGGARVSLDGRGRLLALTIVPPAQAPQAAPCDFDPLLRLVGLDPDALVEVEPVSTPRVYADERRAWTGHIADAGIDVTVEAAALGGRPVWLVVHPPWDPLAQAAGVPTDAGAPPKWTEYVTTTLLIGFAILVIVLARRSILRGDADIRGATRVSLVVALFLVASIFLSGHHAGPTGELALFWWMVREAAMLGGLAFLCYVIVEPYARRYLPHAMVGWTRLVRGRWRDPLVARDVLVGVAISFALFWVEAAGQTFAPDPTRMLAPLQPLLGARHAFAVAAVAAWASVLGILQLFVMYLVVLVIARGRHRVGMIVFFVLWTAMDISNRGVPSDTLDLVGVLAVVFLVAVILVVTITRFGLLATAAMQCAVHLVLRLPVTLDFDAWYAPYSSIAFIAIGALTMFGLRCARPAPA